MVGTEPLFHRLARFLRAMLFETASMFNVRSWFMLWPKFGLDELEEARAWYEKHGWAIVRGVFDASEVAALRAGALRTHAEGNPCDLLADPHLGGEIFVLHPNLVRIVKAVLPDRPVHFGDASASVGFNSVPAFHKDNPDRKDGTRPDWASPYTVVRFGAYLQDHRTHSGALALRDSSHNTPDLTKGRPFAAPTEPGDVVFWSLRTTHSGFATRLRGLVNAFLPLTIMALILGKQYRPWPWLFRPLAADPRIALFATFGIHDAHMDRLLDYMSTRDYAVRQWQQTRYDESLRRKLEENGIDLIDMSDRSHLIDMTKLNVGYAPLPTG
jgi:hypothetical protein